MCSGCIEKNQHIIVVEMQRDHFMKYYNFVNKMIAQAHNCEKLDEKAEFVDRFILEYEKLIR